MASPFLQGFQVGSSTASDALNRNLRMQELKSQQQLQMLQEQQVAQQLAIQMENRNLAIQERADMAKAITAAQQATQPFIQVPMEGQEGLGEMNPPIMEVPNPNAMTQEQAAMRFVLPTFAKYHPDKVPDFLEGVALAEYRKKTNQFQPYGEAVTLPSGQVIEGVRTSPNTFSPVINPSVTNVPNPEGGTTPLIRTGLNSYRPAPQNIEARQMRVMVAREALAKGGGRLFEVNPETGDPFLPNKNFNEAMRISTIPPAIKQKMMEDIAATAGVFEVGKLMFPLLTPENVGAPGWVARNLIDKGVAQAFPWMKIGRASDVKSIATNFRAGLVKAIKSDSNMAEVEREELAAGLPHPENFLSSPQETKSLLAQQLELAAIKSRAAANTVGNPITAFYLTKPEVRQMIESGQISFEDAEKIINNSAWTMIDLIRADVQK